MSAYIHLDEAERMLNKIGELGTHHHNSKFLAGEVASDLNKANASLKLEPATDRPHLIKRIEQLRFRLESIKFK